MDGGGNGVKALLKKNAEKKEKRVYENMSISLALSVGVVVSICNI
jgi:hypothetical protein